MSKKIISFAFAVLVTTAISFAQNTYTAKKDITLKFRSEGGTNGCAVAWNPDKKVYYAVIAGNKTYPLETFSYTGNVQYNREVGIDTRGLWYNTKTQKLEGNGAGEVGIFTFSMNASGEPRDPEVVISGQNQPDFQSVGAFNSAKQTIYYFYDGKVHTYKRSNGKAGKSFELKNLPVSTGELNSTVVFTGRKGEELGFLDYEKAVVYLFSLKGKYTGKVTLPSSAITGGAFRFSFANGKIWLYDIDDRRWTSYSF